MLLFPFQSFAAEREVYIALGDSLAAGQTPTMSIDTGYTDFIALQLANKGYLASFDKSLAFPGYKVSDVWQSVQSDEAKAQLAKATLITISAGANDLLPLLSHNPATGTIRFSQLATNFSLNRVRLGMGDLLEQLKQSAPNAKIYVIGYYFPYTHIHPQQKEGAVRQLGVLNDVLKQTAEEAGATFIEVESMFTEHRLDYLPNNADVHPNELGYMQIANAFLRQYVDTSWMLNEHQLPARNPKTFQQLIEAQPRLKEKIDGTQSNNFTHQYIFPYKYTKASL